MTKRSVQRKRPTTTAHDTTPLATLAIDVEATCGLTIGAVKAAARLLTGATVSLRDDESLGTLAAAGLESLAADLEALSDRALAARGGVA
jgi:hypothetical protein